MNRELLKMLPKRYLCPFCGEWHGWELTHELGYYNSAYIRAELKCRRKIPDINIQRRMFIYFDDDYCYYETIPVCNIGNLKGSILIEDIFESPKQHRVEFTVPFIAKKEVDRRECAFCIFKDTCLICKQGNCSWLMDITFGFEFDKLDYNKFAPIAKLNAQIASLNAKIATLENQEKELQEHEQVIESKELTLKNCEDAVDSNEQVSQKPQLKENKEDIKMANNSFNLNMEFGPNKDENLVSTIMGVAVKNGDSWRIYDKMKKEITDVGDMQLGNLPIYIMPTTKLSEGDLIKDSGEYYFVTNVANNSPSIQTLSVRTGEMKIVVPIKNILGFSCYSKVIALSDLLGLGGDNFDVEKMAIMSAMCGQTCENGSQANQLLPLMLFKDKLGGDKEKMEKMFMISMMTSQNDSGQMNLFLPLMLLNDGKLDGDDDTMKLLLISSGMSGNMSNSNNPLINYLMLDTIMSKKDKNTPKVDDKADDDDFFSDKADNLNSFF